MSVYRALSPADLEAVRRATGAEAITGLQPIVAGIENSNWFLDLRVAGRGQNRVLTLLESLAAGELPFFIALVDALAAAGLPVPVAAQLAGGQRILLLQGKPALVVPRLPGAHVDAVTPEQCAAAGAMLARVHVAARALPLRRGHRDADWWPDAFARIASSLADDVRMELGAALVTATQTFNRCASLAHGIVHGDFFRDNVLFTDGGVSGVLDFFHAANDLLAWDLAIALNDWSIIDNRPDAARAQAFIDAYQAVRPLEQAELAELPALRRAAAARFWLSRLLTAERQRGTGSSVQKKDPEQMRAWLHALG